MKRKSLPTGRDFLFVEGYGNENPGAFQSPRPLRGATCRGRRTTWRFCHFNPRAPCGARRDGAVVRLVQPRFQPTRPLRGATEDNKVADLGDSISTHAPLAGRDTAMCLRKKNYPLFQPTRPLRGATMCMMFFSSTRWYFNPRAPCGARLSIIIAKIPTN